MNLKEKIFEDLKTAMKNKDSVTLGTLRMVKARFIEFETSGANKKVDNEKALGILQNMIKQRQESIKLYQESGRTELADKENQETEVLRGYLPEPISEEVIQQIVEKMVAQTGALGPQDMGKVMGSVMGKLKSMEGLVDGALVQKHVKQALTK